MSDPLGMVRVGWWLKHGDNVQNHMFSFQGSAPYAEADSDAILGVSMGPVRVTQVTFIPDRAWKGAFSLLRQGASGTATPTTIGTYSNASSLSATVPYTLTLSTVTGALDLADGEVLVARRTTASADTFVAQHFVKVEVTPLQD